MASCLLPFLIWERKPSSLQTLGSAQAGHICKVGSNSTHTCKVLCRLPHLYFLTGPGGTKPGLTQHPLWAELQVCLATRCHCFINFSLMPVAQTVVQKFGSGVLVDWWQKQNLDSSRVLDFSFGWIWEELGQCFLLKEWVWKVVQVRKPWGECQVLLAGPSRPQWWQWSTAWGSGCTLGMCLTGS